jgi:hypothetical protein
MSQLVFISYSDKSMKLHQILVCEGKIHELNVCTKVIETSSLNLNLKDQMRNF